MWKLEFWMVFKTAHGWLSDIPLQWLYWQSSKEALLAGGSRRCYTGDESGVIPWRAGRENHCVNARRMSFTSMVPMTIFSQLTVSWAAPSSLVATVTNTRLPLDTVLPANLWTGWSGGGTGGLRSKQQVESQEVTETEIEGQACQSAGFKDNTSNSHFLHFYGNAKQRDATRPDSLASTFTGELWVLLFWSPLTCTLCLNHRELCWGWQPRSLSGRWRARYDTWRPAWASPRSRSFPSADLRQSEDSWWSRWEEPDSITNVDTCDVSSKRSWDTTITISIPGSSYHWCRRTNNKVRTGTGPEPACEQILSAQQLGGWRRRQGGVGGTGVSVRLVIRQVAPMSGWSISIKNNLPRWFFKSCSTQGKDGRRGGVTKKRLNLGLLERTGSKRGRSQTTGNTLVCSNHGAHSCRVFNNHILMMRWYHILVLCPVLKV